MPIKSRSELVRKTTTKAADDDVEKQNSIKKRKLEEQEIIQSDDEVAAAVINKRKRDEQEFKKAKVVVKKQNKRKRKEQESCYEGEDRFSDLPESLRLHILSSLDAKNVVQTSALSKSFETSWASVPVLNFHCHRNYYKRRKLKVFDKFVQTVLSKRDRSSSVKSLSFFREGCCSAKLLRFVFGSVLSHGVKELEVRIDSSTHRKLAWPDFLTSTDSLTSLTLKSYNEDLDCLFLGPRVESRFFKNLIVLKLQRGVIKYVEPFSGCPVLEKLTLINCRVETHENILNIDLLNLSELSIWGDSCCGTIPLCLNLTTPKLKFFKFRTYSFPLLIKTHTDLPILETVVLEFPGRRSYSKDNEKRMEYLLSMLRAVRNVYSSFGVFDLVVMQLSLFEISSWYPFEKLKLDLKQNLKDHHDHEKFLDKTIEWLTESLERPPLMYSCSVMMRI